MSPALVLDLLLVIALVAALTSGLRDGFVRSVGPILGAVAGAIGAFFLVPVLSRLVPFPFLRTFAVVAVAILLLAAGHSLGSAIGRTVGRGIDRTPLRPFDRIGGGLAMLVATALATSLAAGSIGALGAPLLSRAVAQSVVLRGIATLTPDPVEAALARVRAAVLEQGLPSIGEALGGVLTSPGVPQDVPTDTDALAAAAASVVRIGGTAYACGQNQTGSGFVVAEDRIVTNAHVVAGVDRPVVEAPNGQVLEGRVVYFDPGDDLAVVAVDGLAARPLALDEGIPVGGTGVVDGYPYGGPFVSGPAEVLAISIEAVPDIYGSSVAQREVYTLAADVNPGNSGGPLVSADGEVAGVVFGKSSTEDDLGYAVSNTELGPVAQAASGLDDAVAPGSCMRG